MSETITKEYLNAFLEEGLEEMEVATFTQMAYQGFDAKVIREELVSKKWSKELLTNVLVYFLVRGTNISAKATKRSSEACALMLKSATEKGLRARPEKPTTLTIGRIVAAMPEVVAGIIARFPTQVRVLCPEVSPGLPLYLKFSAGASLCTSEEQYIEWMDWARSQDAVINKDKSSEERVNQFGRVQYSSSRLDHKFRRTIQHKCNDQLLKSKGGL